MDLRNHFLVAVAEVYRYPGTYSRGEVPGIWYESYIHTYTTQYQYQ